MSPSTGAAASRAMGPTRGTRTWHVAAAGIGALLRHGNGRGSSSSISTWALSRRTVFAAVIDTCLCHPVLDGLTGETIELAQGPAGYAKSG